MDTNHATGTFFGIVSGVYTSAKFTTSLPSEEAIIQTAILAAVGGAVGWLIVELLKLGKERIKKWKNDKRNG